MGRSNKITKRSVSIDVSFYGTGAIQRRGGGFFGGVPDPEIGSDLQFELWREVPNEEGLWNPSDRRGHCGRRLPAEHHWYQRRISRDRALSPCNCRIGYLC